MRVMIVDDDPGFPLALRRKVNAIVPRAEVLVAHGLEGAREHLAGEPLDLVILDMRLSKDPDDRSGLEILRDLIKHDMRVPALVMSAIWDPKLVREAHRLGALDFLFKGELSEDASLETVLRNVEKSAAGLARVSRRAQTQLSCATVDALRGSSPAIEEVRTFVRRVAGADAPVLIQGETGTGKELVAQSIHAASPRRRKPFVAVDCAAMPPTLADSLLFGHKRGAFTGATFDAPGAFGVAEGGTVFLDEVAELSLEVQAKLLRVLEVRRFRPLGAAVDAPSTARVVSAANADLHQRVSEGRFRADLLFRLEVVSVCVPPLRERAADVRELAEWFLAFQHRPVGFTADALAWLERHPWPGNVRELKNVVQRVALLSERDAVDAAELTRVLGRMPADSNGTGAFKRLARELLAAPHDDGVRSRLELFEETLAAEAFAEARGNVSVASRITGIDRRTLRRRLAMSSTALAPSPPSGHAVGGELASLSAHASRHAGRPGLGRDVANARAPEREPAGHDGTGAGSAPAPTPAPGGSCHSESARTVS